jgi:hypothetical protein
MSKQMKKAAKDPTLGRTHNYKPLKSASEIYQNNSEETVAHYMEREHQDGESVTPNHEIEIHKDWASTVQ